MRSLDLSYSSAFALSLRADQSWYMIRFIRFIAYIKSDLKLDHGPGNDYYSAKCLQEVGAAENLTNDTTL